MRNKPKPKGKLNMFLFLLCNGVRLKKRAVENQNKNKQSLARILASFAFIFGVGFSLFILQILIGFFL